MKKGILVFACSVMSFICVYAQEGSPAFKKHNFGVGLKTDLFSSGKMNNFNPNYDFVLIKLETNKSICSIDQTYSSYFGAFFEYQYRFNESFSLSARLGYNYRKVEYVLNTCSFTGANSIIIQQGKNYTKGYSVFNNLEIPVFATYGIDVNENMKWNFSAGAGVSFMIFGRDENAAASYNPLSIADDIPSTQGAVVLTQDEFIPFAMIGTGLDFNVGKHRMQLNLDYKIQLNKPYFYVYQSLLSNQTKQNKFSQNDIEIGLTFFF